MQINSKVKFYLRIYNFNILNLKNLSYYFEAIGSKQAGSFNLSINARMFETTLTDKVSYNVKNEIQIIEINSTIVPEEFVRKIVYIL